MYCIQFCLVGWPQKKEEKLLDSLISLVTSQIRHSGLIWLQGNFLKEINWNALNSRALKKIIDPKSINRKIVIYNSLKNKIN